MNMQSQFGIDSTDWELDVMGSAIVNYGFDAQEIMVWLKPEMMQSQEARHLLAAIQLCSKEGNPVDLSMVHDALERNGANVEFSRLVEIAKNAPGPANIKAYAAKVRDTYRLNEITGMAMEMVATVNNSRDPSYAMSVVAEMLGKLDYADDGDAILLSDQVSAYMDHQMAVFQGTASNGEVLSTPGISHAFGPIGNNDLIVIAGRPGSGKTELVLEVASELALDRKKPVLLFSLEMGPEQIAERVLTQRAGISIDAINDGSAFTETLPYARVAEAIQGMLGKPFYIDPGTVLTVHDIAIRAKRFAKKNPNMGAIIIDYLGLIKTDSNKRHDIVIGEITGALKRLAKEIKVPVFLLSQLSRKVEERPDKRPMSSDLRDSGAIEQDADKIVMVYRDCYYNPETPLGNIAELINTKRRRGQPCNSFMNFVNGHFVPMSEAMMEEAANKVADAKAPKARVRPDKQGRRF